MARRPSLLRYPALFVVPFVGATGIAFGARSWQLAGNETKSTNRTEVVAVDSASVPETTLVLTTETTLPETTVAPVTDAPTTAPPETTPPETTPPTAPQITLPAAPTNGDGAVLRSLADADRRLYDEPAGCASLARPGASALDCDITSAYGIGIAWVWMDAGLDVMTHVEADGPDVWKVVLGTDAVPSSRPKFASVTADREPALVVGWRSSDRALAVDVVEFDPGRFDPPAVTLHLDLTDGRVALGEGRLDAWTGVSASGSDPSPPTTYARFRYRPNPGWRATVSGDDTPPSGEL